MTVPSAVSRRDRTRRPPGAVATGLVALAAVLLPVLAPATAALAAELPGMGAPPAASALAPAVPAPCCPQEGDDGDGCHDGCTDCVCCRAPARMAVRLHLPQQTPGAERRPEETPLQPLGVPRPVLHVPLPSSPLQLP